MNRCDAEGDLNDSGFSRPMPLIGLYIASISLLCGVLMGFDLVEGLRRRRFWFPCRFFQINSATLTLLGIAVKLPVDINTAMPGRWDQLSKLSGTVLVCIAMANSMPSLGLTNCAFSDSFALAILVITVVANIVTEMVTGVVFAFWTEHVIVIAIMIVLLVITVSSGLFVLTTKNCLGKKYEFIRGEIGDDPDISLECLEKCVEKYSLMAYAADSQHVLGRSATCTAAGAFSLVAAIVFFRAVIKSSFGEFCKGESDYQWSIIAVLLAQGVSICVGAIAPVWRYLRSWRIEQVIEGSVFEVEEYWLGRLKTWRDAPLFRGVHQWSVIARTAWYGHRWSISTLIAAQSAAVVFCNFVTLPSAWLSLLLKILFRSCSPLKWKRSKRRDLEVPEVRDGRPPSLYAEDLAKFVLILEGEDKLVRPIMKSGRLETQNSFKEGSKKRPARVVDILREHSSPGFERVKELGLSLSGETDVNVPEHNSWALPTVALASIVFLIPGIDCDSVRSLLRGVGEGLKYVRLVDKHFDERGMADASEAADVLWEKVDLFGRRLFSDLIDSEGGLREILRGLEEKGRKCKETELRKRRRGEPTCAWYWPPKALGGYYLEKIGRTIGKREGKEMTPEELLQWLSETIADVMGACLTNLPQVVLMECVSSEVEEREERVREAAVLLGESKEVLRFVRERAEIDGHRYPPRHLRHRIDAWASPANSHKEGQVTNTV